jgi:hypothetical protein
MIRRAAMRDVPNINAWVARDGAEGDFTELLSNPMNVALLSGEGGALFVWRGPGIYECHVFFEQRGKEVLALSRRMLAMMREHGAEMFWTAVPVESRHVVIYARLLGMKSHGVREFPHGYCEVFSGR